MSDTPTLVQYLGHSAFKISYGSTVMLVDPFLTGNPKAPCGWEEAAKGCTHVLLSHGHDDHVGDTLAIAKATGCTVVGMVELMAYLAKQQAGLKTEQMNLGGSLALSDDVTVSLVQAYHSTGAGKDGVYTGVAAGIIIKTPTATIYHAGDTAAFSDMGLINDLFAPDVGLLPIGGRFTMDALAAAACCEHFFDFDVIVPMHYATFGVLAPDAREFETLCAAAKIEGEVVAMVPGEEIEV
ncbi:MAG: metal-dependent hydrolase [Alphaproteobacteria bacterium]